LEKKDPIEICQGTLLLSEPFCKDPFFGRSVVLICLHDEDGSFGFILNTRTSVDPDNERPSKFHDFQLYAGGPIDQDRLFFIHTVSQIPESIPLKDGVYWSGNSEYVLSAIDQKEWFHEKGRFVLGYSRWDRGQLEDEIGREE